MAIPAGSLIQQSMVFTQQGTRFSNVIHWKNIDDLNNSNEIANLVELQDLVWAEWRKSMADAVQFLGSVWTLPLLPIFGSRTTAASGEFGDLPDPPSQTTQYVIIRRYALVDERKSRGRTLLAGWPDTYTENNRLTSAGALVVADIVNVLKLAQSASDTDFIPQNYSGKFGEFFDVFKSNLDPVIRSLNARQAAGGL